MEVIFMNYINRSGSSFLCNELSKCPDICVCPEADILFDIFCWKPLATISSKFWYNKIVPSLLNDVKFSAWNLDKKTINSFYEPSISRIDVFFKIIYKYREAYKPSASLLLFKHQEISNIDKALQNLNYTYSYLSLIRDPRGVYNSQKNAFMKKLNKFMSENSFTTAIQYNIFIKKTSQLISNNYLLRYEDLISNISKELQNIIRHYKLAAKTEWKKKGDYIEHITPINATLHLNIDKSPIKGNIHAWESLLSKNDISIIEKYCIVAMRRFKYPLSIKPDATLANNHNLMYRIKGAFFLLKLARVSLKRTANMWPV